MFGNPDSGVIWVLIISSITFFVLFCFVFSPGVRILHWDPKSGPVVGLLIKKVRNVLLPLAEAKIHKAEDH